MGSICLLLLTLLVQDQPKPHWPAGLQGAWDLKIDWQIDSDGARKYLNNPTTYQAIFVEDQLFLYHKALSTLSATKCLMTKDRWDDEGYSFCLAKTGDNRKAFKIRAHEIVFLSHGTYPSTGFRLNRLNLDEAKRLFRTVLENEALLIDNKLLRLCGNDLKKFDEDLRYEDRERVMALNANKRFKNLVWFYGDSETEPMLRKYVEAD